MQEISIDRDLLTVYPDIRLGCLQFSADVRASDEHFWQMLDSTVLPEIQEKIAGKEWSEIPGIRGSRLAYKAFGRNPGRWRVSSEALLRRVRRGDSLYHVNSVVDVNNLISLESGLSVGSYDLRQIQGPIRLRKGGPGEGYDGIGKEFLDMENMLVLADEQGIFGSSMSDSRRAMVTEGHREILSVIYCFEAGIDLEQLLQKASQAFRQYAGAVDVETRIVP
jgi:DNA/RNA-binding domain of Phe-tRNA-synthetase-like protein